MFWTEFSKVTIDESITLKNVPSKGEVRKVMKHVTLAPIKKLEKFNNSNKDIINPLKRCLCFSKLLWS